MAEKEIAKNQDSSNMLPYILVTAAVYSAEVNNIYAAEVNKLIYTLKRIGN